MPLTVSIRSATVHDIAPWAQMRHALWPTASIEEHVDEVKRAVANKDVVNLLAVHRDSGALIGFLEAAIRPYANGCDLAPVAFVEGIWVEGAYREHGVGRRLIEEAEAWARGRGIFEIGSDTELANVLSQEAHKKWGFEETERVVYFRKKL